MTILEQINADFMTAYKNKDLETKNFLGFLKSELTLEIKSPDDAYVIGKLKGMINKSDVYSLDEVKIITPYIPEQMTLESLSERISFIINMEGLSGRQGMGKVMTFLKENYAGQYDGKSAATMATELLG